MSQRNEENSDRILEKMAIDRGEERPQKLQQDIIVGAKIKQVRENSGLTVQELAEKTGFSAAIITQIENRMVSPTLGALVEIANALDMSVSSFLYEGDTHDFSIVRKKDRKVVSRVASKEASSEDYRYESLGAGKKGRQMEPFIVTLKPSVSKPQRMSTHHGEEFIYVISGKVTIWLDKFKDTLDEGDSIYYNSTIPHHIHSSDENGALILAVISQR